MLHLRFADRPGDLRQRANRLRDVARGVTDPAAHQDIERLIAELEERADGCEAHKASPVQITASLEGMQP
jgi:hypothetical protein